MQLQPSGQHRIAVSKACCPVCWDIAKIFNRLSTEKPSQVHFQAHGRHPNLYAVDLPDILDEGVKDELLTKFGITLLQDLVSLFELEDSKMAGTKHMCSESDVSQPESVAFSLSSSSMGRSNLIRSVPRANHKHLSHQRVLSWNRRTHSWDELNSLGDVTVSKV